LKDDLSQWRAYGAAATERYSIGFASRELEHAATKQPHVTFTYVDYNAEAQIARVADLLDRAMAFIRSHSSSKRYLSDLGAAAASRLAGLVPALKMNAYKLEREWRIIIWARPGVDKPFYDAKRGVLRPYLECAL